MQETPRLEVDSNLCVGSQMCTYLAPALFEYRPELNVSVVRASPGADDAAAAREAADSCPVGAILLASEH